MLVIVCMLEFATESLNSGRRQRFQMFRKSMYFYMELLKMACSNIEFGSGMGSVGLQLASDPGP